MKRDDKTIDLGAASAATKGGMGPFEEDVLTMPINAGLVED